MSQSFNPFSDNNSPVDYNSNNQDNDNSSQNINDRSNDLFFFSYEDNRIPSISNNMFNNNKDNSIIEKYTIIEDEKNPSDNNIFEENIKVFLSESKTSTKKNENKNTKLGRKRKGGNQQGKHNKYSGDIIRGRCKTFTIKNIFTFINEIIKIKFNNNIGNGYFIKQLLKLNKKQNSNANVKYNQEFLNKTIGDIFSDDISSKYTNYNKKHNKLLIEELINEKNEEKRIYFKKLFDLTFIQCLKHFNKEETIKELEGMKLFKDIKNELNKKDDDREIYIKTVEEYMNNYEDIINSKKPRKPRIKRD